MTTDDQEGEDVSTTTATSERTGRTERTERAERAGTGRAAPDDTARERRRRATDPALAPDEAAVEPGARRADPSDDAGGAARPDRRLTTVAAGAVAVCAVALLGLTTWSLFRASDLASQQDDRRAAASVAGRFASATMSYDHRDLEGSLAAVTDLASQEYAETYQNAFFQELQPVVDELRARGRVHVRDVYVSEIGDDTATAVVSFDAVIRSTIGTRRLTGSYVRVDLTKEDGAWKADDLTFLATTQEGLDAPGGSGAAGAAGTSPTTAPAAGGG